MSLLGFGGFVVLISLFVVGFVVLISLFGCFGVMGCCFLFVGLWFVLCLISFV